MLKDNLEEVEKTYRRHAEEAVGTAGTSPW